MDLSGIIFVVLALAWGGYLIPMALKRHEDEALTRPVETFSDSVRVVGGAGRPAGVERAASVAAAETTRTAEPVATTRHTITREAARRAARRRRRVLAVLLLTLVAVSVTAYLGHVPWWSTAIPGGLIIGFLVVARLTVRAQEVRRAAVPAEAPAPTTAPAAVAKAEVEPDLGAEDTQGISREALAEAVAAPVMDDGGLWDPLPMTLPTYVHKAHARRTVRTIEITGVTSSGHDAADSELARAADEARVEAESVEAEAEQRKAAGA